MSSEELLDLIRSEGLDDLLDEIVNDGMTRQDLRDDLEDGLIERVDTGYRRLFELGYGLVTEFERVNNVCYKRFRLGEFIFECMGTYSSWDGLMWTYGPYEVKPVEVTVTEYRRV
jgi:hypothetical protein